MTRKSRRELERAIDDLGTTDPTDAVDLTVRYAVVDAEGAVVDGFTKELAPDR